MSKFEIAAGAIQAKLGNIVPRPSRYGARVNRKDPDILNVDVFYDHEPSSRFSVILRFSTLETQKDQEAYIEDIIGRLKQSIACAHANHLICEDILTSAA